MTTPQRHSDKIRKLTARKETEEKNNENKKEKHHKNEQEQNTTDNNRWMITSYNKQHTPLQKTICTQHSNGTLTDGKMSDHQERTTHRYTTS
jgi:hypothetical protein